MAIALRGLLVYLFLFLALLKADAAKSDFSPVASLSKESHEMVYSQSLPFGKAWKETKSGGGGSFLLRRASKSQSSAIPSSRVEKTRGTLLNHKCRELSEIIPSLPRTDISFPFREFL